MISYSFHLSSKKHALTSARKVASVSKHNLRQYKSDEYSKESIIVLCGSDNILEDVKEIYHKEFDQAIAEYNQGKRSDRQIQDYMKNVSENSKTDVAAEAIIQLGDKEFWMNKTDEQKRDMEALYEEQLERLKELSPDFKIASAVMHLDEASPHMHIVGVPVASGYKRGLKKQVAKTRVFTSETLAGLQESLHALAEEQMEQHPEIFADESMKEKERGRNSDWSKDYLIGMKQKQAKQLDNEIAEGKCELDEVTAEIHKLESDKEELVEDYVQTAVENERVHDFLKAARSKEPKTPLAKIIVEAWNRFCNFWDKHRKPEAEKTARKSVLEMLHRNKEIVDKEKADHTNVIHNHRNTPGMEI